MVVTSVSAVRSERARVSALSPRGHAYVRMIVELGPQGPAGAAPDVDQVRLFDEPIGRRRPVVVAVPGVTALDDPADPVERDAAAGESERAVISHGHLDQAIAHRPVVPLDRVGDRLHRQRVALQFGRPAISEGRCGEPRQDPPPLRDLDRDLPDVVRPRLGGGHDRADQLLDIELGRLGHPVDVDDDARGRRRSPRPPTR